MNAQANYKDYILESGNYNGHFIQLVKVISKTYDGFGKLYKEEKTHYEVRIFFINRALSYVAKNYIFMELEEAQTFFNIKNDCKK